jgi:hypothetical protein
MLRNSNKLSSIVARNGSIFFKPSSFSYLYPLYFIKTKISSFIFSTMKPTPIPNLSASKWEFLEPTPVSKPTRSSGCEPHPSLKAMVRAQPFLGHDDESPCHHLLEYEEMCSCLNISGVTQETLKWKLFPFSHREGETMVHICHIKYEWGLG